MVLAWDLFRVIDDGAGGGGVKGYGVCGVWGSGGNSPPSVSCDALPPVVRGPQSGNAARILPSPSAVVPFLIPSSFVSVTSSPPTLVLIGTISSSNHPASCAASAFLKLSAAYRSISSLEMA